MNERHKALEAVSPGQSVMGMDTLLTRRSIRKFKSTPVSADMIDKIIRAGMSAPSAGNEQPWHFVILDDRKMLDEIMKFHPHAAMLKESTVALLVCCDMNQEKHKGYWVQDMSAATENMLLAAHELGLGSVWLGVHPREDREAGFRKLLDLPGNIVPFSLLPIGHADEKKGPAERYQRERVHNNKW